MEQFGVATKAIIFNKNGEILIVNKSDKDEINPKQADIPGGRLEFGEDIISGLKRELMEEVALDVEVLAPSRVWGFVKNNLHLVGITFATIANSDEVELSFEHDGFAWVTQNQIAEGDYPGWIRDEVTAAIRVYDQRAE